MSVIQVQVNYQIQKLYIVAKILKYKSVNLIILYYCVYSELLGTLRVAVQNFIKLMRNTGFGS